MVFQDYALFPHLTAAENVAFGLRRLSRAERAARVASLLETVGLAGLGGRYPHQLSGGQQQRVALARALAPRPRLVLLDEPFNTLDAGLREQVRSELLAILRAEGVAVLLVTHDQNEALTSADRVAVMRAGRIEQVGAPAAVYNRPATRFVASFMGEGTFLPAAVVDGRLETPFGPIPLPSEAGVAPALLPPRVDLLVRPEEVIVEPDPAGNAVVVSRRPRGPDVDYDLALRHQPPTQLHPDAETRRRGEEHLAAVPCRTAQSDDFGAATRGYWDDDDGAEPGRTAQPEQAGATTQGHRGESAPSPRLPGPTPTLHAHAAAWLAPGTAVQVRFRLRHLVLFAPKAESQHDRALVARCLVRGCSCPTPATGQDAAPPDPA
jgi:ABC-type Fe3+/spermidine/putrescine transport system ATPase subunit